MILLLLATLTVATPAAGPAVVRVDDVALDAPELAARATSLRAAAPRLKGQQLLDAVIGDLVLAQEARRLGLQSTPAVLAAVETEKARAIASLFAETILPAGVKVTQEEIVRLYHMGNDTVRLSLVVLATEQEAAQARRRLEQGGEWALEASRSLDPSSASKRGDTGVMSRMQVDDALATAVFAAKPGTLVGPVQLANGWAVARVDERSLADERELPKFRPQIEAYARRTAAGKAKAHLLGQRRNSASVTVDDAFIKTLKLPIVASPADLDRTVATVGTRALKLRDVLPAIRSTPAMSHGSTMIVTRAVHVFVDDLLLAEEGFRAGVDRSPAGAAAVARAEVRALARALGEDFLARQPSGATDEKKIAALNAYVSGLRKAHKTWVDPKAALAAVSRPN